MHLHNINKELRKTFSPGPMTLIQSARSKAAITFEISCIYCKGKILPQDIKFTIM